VSHWLLQQVYDQMGGPYWTNSDNWLTDAPFHRWYGLVTDWEGDVAGLHLGDNALTGPISAEIATFDDLVVLDLGNNRLTGPIPGTLGNLRDLSVLLLDSSELTGPIPRELGDLRSLVQLDLGNNRLTGAVPSSLGDLGTTDLQARFRPNSAHIFPCSPPRSTM